MLRRAFTIGGDRTVFGVSLTKLIKREQLAKQAEPDGHAPVLTPVLEQPSEGSDSPLPPTQQEEVTPVNNDQYVPNVVRWLVQSLETEDALNLHGIFRISPSAKTVQKLRLQLDRGVEEKLLVPHDEHVLASLLKTFYRELPEPLIADTFFDNLTTAAQDGSEAAMLRVVQTLPTLHLINLQFLLSYLDKLILHAEHNKMDLSNIALLFAPNVIGSPLALVESHVVLHLIMKKLIEHNRAIRALPTRPVPFKKSKPSISDLFSKKTKEVLPEEELGNLKPTTEANKRPNKIRRRSRARTASSAVPPTLEKDAGDGKTAVSNSSLLDAKEHLLSKSAPSHFSSQLQKAEAVATPQGVEETPALFASVSMLQPMELPQSEAANEVKPPSPVAPTRSSSLAKRKRVPSKMTEDAPTQDIAVGIAEKKPQEAVETTPAQAAEIKMDDRPMIEEKVEEKIVEEEPKRALMPSLLVSPLTPNAPIIASPLRQQFVPPLSPTADEAEEGEAAEEDAAVEEDVVMLSEEGNMDFSRPISTLTHSERKKLRQTCRTLRHDITQLQERRRAPHLSTATKTVLSKQHRATLLKYQRLKKYIESDKLQGAASPDSPMSPAGPSPAVETPAVRPLTAVKQPKATSAEDLALLLAEKKRLKKQLHDLNDQLSRPDSAIDEEDVNQLYAQYVNIKMLLRPKTAEAPVLPVKAALSTPDALTLEERKKEKKRLQKFLKEYERTFAEVNGRPVASENDIKEVLHLYSHYQQLKTSLA